VGLDVGVVEEALDLLAVERQRDLVLGRQPQQLLDVRVRGRPTAG
jgi:hypothetical protein